MIKQAIIPLAGLGTRLLPLSSVFAKELLPINGKPGIEYILDECIDANIKEIVFIISKKKNIIKKYFYNDKFYKKIIKKKKDARIIKEYKNDLYRYKLIDNDRDCMIENYIDSLTLAVTDFYEKKIERVFQIPYQNTIIELTIKKYFIGPKTCFVKEYRGGEVTDFYFESKEEYDSFSLKEDLASFLSCVM